MDKITCISYTLFQNQDEELKNIAIQLLNGDVDLREIKRNSKYTSLVIAAEKKVKKGIKLDQVTNFVQKYLFSE